MPHLTSEPDVEFVRTHDGQLPNKNNSTPLDGADGRGSCVWFNQASMFQSSELGYPTIREAVAAGIDPSCDAGALLQNNHFPLS